MRSGRITMATLTLTERILRHVSPEPFSGCWLWTASVDHGGYGQINIGKFGVPVIRRAHRVSYSEFVGPIPEGLDLDHLCRVRCCVNPRHLEPVTFAENVRRGIGPSRGGQAMGAIRKARTHCIRGHEFAAGNEMFQTMRGRKTRYCRMCKELSRAGLLDREPLLDKGT
jgi:hypothetical protein